MLRCSITKILTYLWDVPVVADFCNRNGCNGASTAQHSYILRLCGVEESWEENVQGECSLTLKSRIKRWNVMLNAAGLGYVETFFFSKTFFNRHFRPGLHEVIVKVFIDRGWDMTLQLFPQFPTPREKLPVEADYPFCKLSLSTHTRRKSTHSCGTVLQKENGSFNDII